MPWLAASFLLAGLGTVLLGPILPDVASRWHLTDAQSGILMFAKFTGAFCGGVLVPRRLRLGILLGTLLCCLGFGCFAVSPSLLPGALSLFVAGLGLGFVIAATNILAGRRWTAHTGSAISALNFFWSAGAVSAGLLIAALTPHLGLRRFLLFYAATFLAVAAGGALTSRTSAQRTSASEAPQPTALSSAAFARFLTLLFLYGGLETCLTGWLTTFTTRYGDAHLLGGQSGTVLLWAALTAGRLLGSLALRYTREATIQRAALALSVLFTAALATSHHSLGLSLNCLLLGLSLAPFFPATFGMLMHLRPSPRQAGLVLAVSGLGAASFPWLMGLVSAHTGSLREAMAVPATLALALLAVSLLPSAALPPEPLSAIASPAAPAP